MGYSLYEEILKLARKHQAQLIFNPPATILIINGKKYVAKAHEEEFDEEKGLLMCLAQANGYEYEDIKRLISGAKKQEKIQENIQDDEIRVGNYVKVLDENGSELRVGGVYKVTNIYDVGLEDGIIELLNEWVFIKYHLQKVNKK